MRTGRLTAPLAIALIAMAAAEGPAQGQGTAEDTLGGEDAPVIIEDRPAPENHEETPIRSAEETFVQIHGAWAADESACKAVEGSEGAGLYVTDTVIRWEDATCSIRDVDSEDGAATVYAFCATETGRRDRTFRLEVSGEDRLTLSFLAGAGEREVSLRRCEAAR